MPIFLGAFGTSIVNCNLISSTAVQPNVTNNHHLQLFIFNRDQIRSGIFLTRPISGMRQNYNLGFNALTTNRICVVNKACISYNVILRNGLASRKRALN